MAEPVTARRLARVQHHGDDAAGAARLARAISGVPVRSALLWTPGRPSHPEDSPAVIGHVDAAWWDAASGDLLAALAFNGTAQASLVDRAMRPWRGVPSVSRIGCAVVVPTRETPAGFVVAVERITLDLVTYPAAPGAVLRPLDGPDDPVSSSATNITPAREGGPRWPTSTT